MSPDTRSPEASIMSRRYTTCDRSEIALDIELRYFDDCPNWEATSELLEELIADLDSGAALHTRRVATPEEAEALGFRGSPTVMIDGDDPFADSDAPVGLACRLYRTEAGFAGSPSAAQLRSVLAGD